MSLIIKITDVVNFIIRCAMKRVKALSASMDALLIFPKTPTNFSTYSMFKPLTENAVICPKP